MQDFDTTVRKARAESDRTFKIGGEVFTARAHVAPEVIAEWETKGDEAEDGKASLLDQIALVDRIILEFIEPGQEELWRKVRDPKVDEPVTLQDQIAVITWLVEAQSGRPTVQPSDSGRSGGTTGTSSRGASSLRAVGASKA